MRADVEGWPVRGFKAEGSSVSFVMAGGFSEISGWTPSTASQWAVQETGFGNVIFSSRKTRSKSISSSSTKYSVPVVELGGYGIERRNVGGLCGE